MVVSEKLEWCRIYHIGDGEYRWHGATRSRDRRVMMNARRVEALSSVMAASMADLVRAIRISALDCEART
jgi:hypothetical protein